MVFACSGSMTSEDVHSASHPAARRDLGVVGRRVTQAECLRYLRQTLNGAQRIAKPDLNWPRCLLGFLRLMLVANPPKCSKQKIGVYAKSPRCRRPEAYSTFHAALFPRVVEPWR